MPHQLCFPVKREYEATKARSADLWENCCEVVPSSVALSPVAKRRLFSSMAMYSGGRQAGEDDESLTGMMTERTTTEPYHPNHATHQRNQFWKLRYEVQQNQSLFDEKAQRIISFRLTALHRLARFNVRAIRETKVRQVLKQLLEPGGTPRHDKRRLRKRSQYLLRRLNGTIYANQQRGIRNTTWTTSENETGKDNGSPSKALTARSLPASWANSRAVRHALSVADDELPLSTNSFVAAP
ncbi:hypothetical protein K469DRAFT_746661 [Zopfia rhizophila CBS 207.26]|uniref:Uncharacterized protein n=1 Tax=Zopfia rhizophila CBS 207.26 TaxID=1314779 RepID=A0A6A6EK44_9PEZI|nr:hypothetical protein K469DRAFT_746661 [Zopfia rhizophila CBS 207.26]